MTQFLPSGRFVFAPSGRYFCSVTEPIQRRASQSREAILEAAAQLVYELGASSLTLDATCSRAGMSKGGLLYHFRSKEDLLVALMDHRHQLMESAIHKEFENDPRPDLPGRKHRAMIRALFAILLSDEPFQLAVMGGVAIQLLASGGECSRRLNESFNCHHKKWQVALDEDRLSPLQSMAIHCSLDGLISHQFTHQENHPREVLLQMRDYLLGIASDTVPAFHLPTSETA